MLKCIFYLLILFALYMLKNNMLETVKDAANECIVNNPEIIDFCNNTGLQENNDFILCFKEKIKKINFDEKYKSYINKFIDFIIGIINSKLKTITNMIGMGDTNMMSKYACDLIKNKNISAEDISADNLKSLL